MDGPTSLWPTTPSRSSYSGTTGMGPSRSLRYSLGWLTTTMAKRSPEWAWTSRTTTTLASGVEAILWGPVSRRVVVAEANHRSRVYDGRDGSWIDLGRVSEAQWSPDEERLLFAEEGYLSLLVDHRVEKLCDLTRIGPIRGAVISAEGDKAFR